MLLKASLAILLTAGVCTSLGCDPDDDMGGPSFGAPCARDLDCGSRCAHGEHYPGGICTNILRNARFYADAHGGGDHADANVEFARIARTTPEQAARAILAGVRRGRPRILIGRDARAIDRLQRWLPVRYTRVVSALLRLSARLGYPRASRRPPPSNPSRLESSSADLTTAGATSLSMRSTDSRDAGAAIAKTPTTLRA